MWQDTTWSDFPLLSDPDEATKDYVEVPDNGFQLCIEWAAGPALGARLPRGPEIRQVEVNCEDRLTGTSNSHMTPWTEEDDNAVDFFVNSYLAEAGIPARPRGYRWFLKRPPSISPGNDAFNQISSAVIKAGGDGSQAAEVVRVAQRILPELYD